MHMQCFVEFNHSIFKDIEWTEKGDVCSFVYCITSQSTAMVMSGWSVHLTTPFSLDRLEQVVNQYLVYIHLLVTDNNPFEWISLREENDSKNYFMINLHESMGLGRDQSPDPWICSQICICNQTRYRLRYAARLQRWGPMFPISTPLKWPKTADDIRMCILYLLIFTRISMIEKIENNIEGYFKSYWILITQSGNFWVLLYMYFTDWLHFPA